MKRVVGTGSSLLVDGPASVTLISGKANVLGAPLRISEKIVVREGKRLPLWVTAKASFDVMLGEGAAVNEVEGGAVSFSWSDAAKGILSLNAPVTVLVLGGGDSGKTSFCTFLVNEAMSKKWTTGVIDADLGQSDVGPPSTVGFSLVAEPVKDLFDIDAEDAVFVGSTSPNRTMSKAIDGLTKLKIRAMKAGVDFLVINTDGWVEGEEAVAYKNRLVSKVGASAVVGIQRGDALAPVLDAVRDAKVFVVDSPQLIQARSREKRKLLRELSYKKYLKRAKMHSLSFSWLKLEDSLLGAGGPLPHKRLEMLRTMLGTRIVYSEESVGAIFAVLGKGKAVAEEQVEAAEGYFGKRVKVMREGEEQGLLVGLMDEADKFLGIGILHDIDYKRSLLKVYTPVSEKVHTLCFGQIKLDKNCREIGLSTVCSSYLL
jgi:polynucleotide 5'-hydroxyl-kinase GRC3/NOL9